jgi:hypothetical protein
MIIPSHPAWNDLQTPDWRELNRDTLDCIIDALDKLHIDVVEFSTESDNYAFYFQHQSKRAKDLNSEV